MAVRQAITRAFGLDGKVAIVTGAASGIGREAARILAQAGAAIIGADVNEEGLAQTGRILRAEGGSYTGYRVDVSEKEEVERLADAALEEARSLDIWINCAALIRLKRSKQGSHLTVVCSAPELAEFGAGYSTLKNWTATDRFNMGRPSRQSV